MNLSLFLLCKNLFTILFEHSNSHVFYQVAVEIRCKIWSIFPKVDTWLLRQALVFAISRCLLIIAYFDGNLNEIVLESVVRSAIIITDAYNGIVAWSTSPLWIMLTISFWGEKEEQEERQRIEKEKHEWSRRTFPIGEWCLWSSSPQ